MTKRTIFSPTTHLRMLNKRGKVALFVGAGLSHGCGLPSWEQLIDRILNQAYKDDPQNASEALQHFSPAIKARTLRTSLGKNFNQAVADSLYETSYAPSSAVLEIAQSGIRRICTYNLDDILEEAYATDGRQFHSILQDQRFNNNFKGTAIFHPHGYLPSGLDADTIHKTKLVLCEEDYHEMYSHPYSWSNVVQLSLLLNFTCLFVGVSLQDPNLRRLLDIFAKMNFSHYHYAIFSSPKYAVGEDKKLIMKHVKRTLDNDFSSLRIKPIWVRTYDEIPNIFKAIRNKKESNLL